MKKFRVLLLLFAAMSVIGAAAAVPEGYYSRAEGKKKAELKAAMKAIIGKASVLAYGSGAGRTWTGFYSTDRYDGNKVRDRYCNDIHYFSESSSANAASAPGGMNIEHSFPKSWWGGTENQAYKDLFNLMPCEQKINSSKSNYAMGVVTTVNTNNGCTKVGKGKAGTNNNANLWEPADKWKGDFARSYFYMVTSYSSFTWTGEALNMLENNEYPTMQRWATDLLLEWCRQDPVDQIEIDRNEAVYKIQGNRNPFVDFPSLGEYIWGDSIDYAFSVNGNEDGPVLPDTPDIDVDELMAYEASEIVSSIYSCRFDASWSKYKEGCEYTLDVYQKDASGRRSSIEGFPVLTTENTYRVTNVKPATTYYYDVAVLVPDAELARSNEVRVDIPAVKPVFDVDPSQVTIASQPGQPSAPVQLKVKMVATPENTFSVLVGGPFEVSADGQEWQQLLTLTAKSGEAAFLVRMQAVEEAGTHKGTLLLSTKGVDDRYVNLVGTSDELLAFFEDFEQGTKGAYAEATVDCRAATWRLSSALIANDSNKNDERSLRMKSGGVAEMLTDKQNGCDSIWFYGGNFNNDTGATVSVSYSADGGETWVNVVRDLSFTGWERYGFEVKEEGTIRLKFEGGGTSGKRVNIDDIQMSDYFGADGIESNAAVNVEDNRVFDLCGRPAGGNGCVLRKPVLPKGVYIMGGRKVLVR